VSIENEDTDMTTNDQIAEACKRIVPNPEHGPDQYLVVIEHLNTEGDFGNLCDLPLAEAVEVVLVFMNEI
jgi:hypothetical protein